MRAEMRVLHYARYKKHVTNFPNSPARPRTSVVQLSATNVVVSLSSVEI
jgi:hypothetical protein